MWATLTATLRIQLNSLLLKDLNWHNDSQLVNVSVQLSTLQISLEREAQFKFLLHGRLVSYQYCAGFAVSPNVCCTELKAVWWHPADVVCCDSTEPLIAVQPHSKAAARQMARSEAELAKHGLTRATVRAGTDRLLADSTWQSGGSQNELGATY